MKPKSNCSVKTRKLLSIAGIKRFKDPRNHPMWGVKGKRNPRYGQHHSSVVIAKMSQIKMGSNNPMWGRKGKLHPMYGRHHTAKWKKEHSKKMLGENNPMFGKHPSDDALRRMLVIQRPNKMEQMILSILNSLFPRLFKYVGNGKLFIDGKCPDFVSADGSMLLIEFNGEYWHRGENTRTRARHFAKYGYRTLFIWDMELKNPERLKKKILKFVNL